ncbi:LytTR family DNA-binding domain-containing protein [Aureisphaera galaxeae]|uniref:LytR/AlgR family response regulator transcription factor n=1 Tax=Aureisphaera galaxeae TaxID=1538023 RepID=UPI002350C67D|nr:LytTR family DNA-binding domain-containing protein [Aureisphaera galaxeae]MDC8005508.1 LytTR family DNA-binding domain-containing protein [Aureisphaera galaxeae]
MKETYKAIIVDDEPVAREILETHLSKLDQIEMVASCKSAAEAFSAINQESIDLIFLDINMPEIDGLMFANAIQGKMDVIFTTAYREYAVEGFNLSAVDYLLKPISLERLMKGVQKFIDSKSNTVETPQNDFTFFRCDRQMKKVAFNDITHIESYGDYVKLHMPEETLVTRETMSHVLQKLPNHSFIRVHRSYVVSLSKIDSYTPEVITINRVAVPISRSYREEVMEKLKGL